MVSEFWRKLYLIMLVAATAAAQGGTTTCNTTCSGPLECRAGACRCQPGFTAKIISGTSVCEPTEESFERHPEDGWFNNLLHPDWGVIDGELLRRSKTAYSDGVYAPSGVDRPNPFDISRIAHQGDSGRGSVQNRTAMLVFFGQQLVEEVLDAQGAGCPVEFMNIPVPQGHPFNPKNLTNLEMPFQRTRYNFRTGYSPNNPRQQLNEITPYIDGNLVYSASKAWGDTLRSFKDGKLAAKDENADIKNSLPIMNDINLPFANPPPPRDHVLRSVNRFYRIGNPRGNENPFMLSYAIIWFRYHNYWAARLKSKNPTWNDERLFNEARKRVIGQYQKIVFHNWLPTWLGLNSFDIKEYPYKNVNGSKNPYNGYDPNVHVGISQEFQSAAMRFGHTLVVSGVYTRNLTNRCEATRTTLTKGNAAGHSVKGLRLCNAFWVPQEAVEEYPGLDNLLLGMIFTKSEREDRIIVTDLRGNVFGPLEWSRRDLMALNIQRGRDHGLPGYNAIREAYGLPRQETWQAIADEVENSTHSTPETIADLRKALNELQKLYGNTKSPDELDIFAGGILETTLDGPGPLFRAILLDQFLRIRHGDRFWYENEDNGLFTPEDIAEIESTNLVDILALVTNIPRSQLPDDVFKCHGSIQSCSCMDPFNLTDEVEECSPLQHYDFFTGSEVSFAVSFLILALAIPITIAVMIMMAKAREKKMEQEVRRVPRKGGDSQTKLSALEWMGVHSGERAVIVELIASRKKIVVHNATGSRTLRLIDLRNQKRVVFCISQDRDMTVMSIKVLGETDLVLKFENGAERREAIAKLENFLREIHVDKQDNNMPTKDIYHNAITYDERKKHLEKFFRAVTFQVLKGSNAKGETLGDLDAEEMEKIRNTKLTRTEFAESMGMQPSAIFVRNMFLLVDRSKDGFVSFEEFMNMFMTFSNGTAQDKARMLFDMYDLRRNGHLSRSDVAKMIRSMLDLADATVDNNERVDQLIESMFEKAGIKDQAIMTFDDFCKIFASEDYGDILKNATLGLEVGGTTIAKPKEGSKSSLRERRATVIKRYQENNPRPSKRIGRSRSSRVSVKTAATQLPPSPNARRWNTFIRYVENYRRQIFWVTLYTLVTAGIFIERAYYYSVEREHAGLRRLAGYGVSVTRGAASGMMFTYASLMVTMSRNTLTFFRETFLHRFIPFDSMHSFHKYIAFLGLMFTAMHCIGHGINLYHICTQASADANCYFREYFRSSSELASFHYWAWTTITGLTGIILTIIIIIMYVFAIEYSRRHLFKAFWTTHSLYIPLYFFLTLHGAGRLVQDPIWGYFFIGPVVIFVLDKLVSLSRNKVELPIKKSELLPSGVTYLAFRKPINFEYKSGQWVRIACLKLGSNEYHPFTLTSAPHEETLSLHIRAVGPWTNNIRRLYDPSLHPDDHLPKIFLDGPFGEGHQDWYRFPVSVLVGGGIGVTPFASILKDLVHKSRLKIKFPCQKVYFLWVTRTQKSFEWLTDIIREVETGDERQLVDVHIFITQFQQKFDLRTTMLYICERHFQRVEGQSLFTGLRATTHFGRPLFQEFLYSLTFEHQEAKQIGVFSCGPPPMTLSVQKACTALNRLEGATFSHHYENF